jgi:hypothetical protein
MNQCDECRHKRGEDGEARCRKRLVQKGSFSEGTHRLEMVPAVCAVINRDNNCPEFRRPFLHWLRRGR